MGSEAFDTLRIVLVLAVSAVRLGLMPYYLQSYLNLAYEKVEAQKKESGRISNKDLQKKVSIDVTFHLLPLFRLLLVLVFVVCIVYC